jgi:hypothetical protein
MHWLAEIQRIQGRRQDALKTLRLAMELARQTGLGFNGPALLASIALASDDPLERANALQEGEVLLQVDSLAHCHLTFYPNAIDAALAARDWQEALRYATALVAFVGSEPNTRARLAISRGQCLANVGISGLSKAHVSELRTIRADAERRGFKSFLPGIDAVLKQV